MEDPIELLFRPAVTCEQELITALKAEAGVYGAVGEMLKAYIRRGYHLLEAHARPGLQDGSHADFEAAGAYRFKLLSMFHTANPGLEPGLGEAEAPLSPQPRGHDPDLVHEVEMAEHTASLQIDAGSVVETVAPPETAPDAAPLAAEPVPAPQQEGGEAPPEEVPADWSRFRGVAAFRPPKRVDS